MVSDHAVQLDASFSKYGYSAHLRTKDSADDSQASSLYGDSSSTFHKEQWAAGRKLGETMRFYQKPIVRQYFHKGLLWRAREAQEVASYELFIDLFYVGIIAITGDHAAEHPDGEAFLHFIITFVMGWKFWSDISTLIGWFDSDDVLRRFSILFILTCLLGFTTNINDAFSHTYAPLVGFYLAARFFLCLTLFWYAWQIPMVRACMIGNGILTVVPAALWIGSIHVEGGARQGLIWPAMALDTFGQFAMIIFQRPPAVLPSRFKTWAKRVFEFSPGANIEHRIERTGAFVTLVFGSCVLGLLYQSSKEFGINAFFGKAVLGLIQAFTFNWLYFEIDSFNLHTHAIRRHVFSGKCSSVPSPLRHPHRHHNTNACFCSTYMVLYTSPFYNVLCPLGLSPCCPRSRARLPRRPRRILIRDIHPSIRGAHLARPALVLLRRTRHVTLLHGHHRLGPRPQENPTPALTKTPAPRRSIRRLNHHYMLAVGTSE